MRRALVVGVVAGLLAACPPSLKEGRAYRCTPSGGTAQCEPWVCRLDGYCHDPAVGEPLDCEAPTDCGGGWFCGVDRTCHDPAVGAPLPCGENTDCGGGWFCGKDARCHDPALPAPLPCDDDTQCAGGWRCNTEGTCVDPGPPVTTPGGTVTRLVLRSPLLPPQQLLSMGPTVPRAGGRLGTSLALGAGPVLTLLTVESEATATDNRPRLGSVQWEASGALTHVAASWPVAAFALDGGAGVVFRLREDRQDPDLLYSGADTRGLWPLAVAFPDDGQRPIAVATRVAGDDTVRVVTQEADGGAGLTTAAWTQKAAPLIDVAGLPTIASGGSSLDIPLAVLDQDSLTTVLPSNPSRPVTVPLALIPNGLATYQPMMLRTSVYGFGVAYRRTDALASQEETGVLVGPWEYDGSGFPSVPVGKGTNFRGELTRACPQGERLRDFALDEASIARAAAASVTCEAPDGRLRVYTGSELVPQREYEPGVVDGRSPDSHAWASRRGHLQLGNEPAAMVPLVLDTQPEWLGLLDDFAVGGLAHAAFAQSDVGLVATLYTDDADTTRGRVVEGPVAAAFWSPGYVLAYFGVGRSPTPVFSTSGLRVGSGVGGAYLWGTDAGTQAFVGALGDAVFTGERDVQVGTLQPTTRPSPGFDITELAVTPATDAGAYEGWALVSGRLFHLAGRTLDRWTSAEVTLGGLEPVAVWYEGPRAWLSDATGRVFSLPERVSVSEALGPGVTSVTGACGTAFGLRDGQLFRLGDALDGGPRAWLPVDDAAFVPRFDDDGGVAYVPAPLPRQREAGRLFRSNGRVLLSSTTGLVYELHLDGCPR